MSVESILPLVHTDDTVASLFPLPCVCCMSQVGEVRSDTASTGSQPAEILAAAQRFRKQLAELSGEAAALSAKLPGAPPPGTTTQHTGVPRHRHRAATPATATGAAAKAGSAGAAGPQPAQPAQRVSGVASF